MEVTRVFIQPGFCVVVYLPDGVWYSLPNVLFISTWNSRVDFCYLSYFLVLDFLGRTELRLKDILKETREKRGPILKYAKLQEVPTGDVVVKLDLQLFSQTNPFSNQRTL